MSRKKRVAVSFDDQLYSYIKQISETRKQPFSDVCASMLREIMRDDLKAESKTA